MKGRYILELINKLIADDLTGNQLDELFIEFLKEPIYFDTYLRLINETDTAKSETK